MATVIKNGTIITSDNEFRQCQELCAKLILVSGRNLLQGAA